MLETISHWMHDGLQAAELRVEYSGDAHGEKKKTECEGLHPNTSLGRMMLWAY